MSSRKFLQILVIMLMVCGSYFFFFCREANENLDWLHERMPAILADEAAVSAWLDKDLHGYEALKVLHPVEKSAVRIKILKQH